MKIILQEHNLWGSGLKAFCGKNNEVLENPKCYARHILGVQEARFS